MVGWRCGSFPQRGQECLCLCEQPLPESFALDRGAVFEDKARRARLMTIPVIFSTGSLYPFGLDRAYGWAAETGYEGVEIMMDERWDTHQDTYLSHLAHRHGIPVLALHTPLYKGAWRLDPGETLVRSAGLAEKVGAPVVIVHPPPPGRALSRWAKGPLKRARTHDVSVAVENMPRPEARHVFSIRR